MSQERRTMLKRRRLLSIAGTATLVGLAGCGGDGGDSDTTTTTSPATDTTTSSTTTESTTTESTTTESTTTTTQNGETTTESTTTTTTTEEPSGGIPPGTELVFDGRVSGWLASAPDSIAGTNNPTLQLQEGAEYTFTWENTDGAPHNVVIENESGDTDYVSTEIITSGSQSETFTAQAGMASYYCEVHPSSMRGPVEIV